MAHDASLVRALKALDRWNKIWVLLWAMLFSAVLGTASFAQDTPQEIEVYDVGVLTTEGATRALESWRPTFAFLNQEAELLELPYRFALRPHTVESLSAEVAGGNLDFAITNPALFVAMEVESGARAVLSQAHMWNGRTHNEIGAVVFVRTDSSIRRLDQMRGASVMAVSASDFDGWWLAEQEFRRYRLDPDTLLDELIFSGGNQREVVYAVQSGLVDAGVVPAGVLEQLAQEGVIDLADFSPVSLNENADHPFWVSTELYPEWLLSAMPGVSEETLALVINSLLNIQADSTESKAAGDVVWQAPQNYQVVHDLLISLRVRPYENYLVQAIGRIYRAYRWWILGGTTLIVFSLIFLVYQLRRNMMLAEERKNVLQSEIRSKIFYRSAVEEHTVFCMLKPDGRISHVNDSFCETSARARADLLNRPLSELLPKREQEILQDDIMKAMEVGAPWDGPLKILREDGTVAWAQTTVIPVSGAGDELSEIAVVATDMTQTRKGISDESFHDSLELIEDQVVVLRPGSLDLLYMNKAAEARLLKARMGGVWKDRSAKDIVTESDLRALELRCEALQEGPQRRMTWEVTAQNGTPYEISLEYVQPENDEPRFISIYRDITARKVAEKAKNEFVATVSHELRTPLTSMKGALGLAMSGAIGEMTPQMDKMIGMAANNCDRLVLLINDILDMEKIEAGKMDFKMAPVDMADIVDKALESNKFYAEKFGATMRLHQVDDGNGFMTMGDQNRLTQVMDNLMSNAAKFSEKGSEVIVSLIIHKGRLRFSIRDFGCGIPKSAQATIFDKFTQADMGDTRTQQGTGLGLSIAKLIVESHKGAIFFASEPDIGTEFYVDLPRIVDEELVPLEETGEPVVFSSIGLNAGSDTSQIEDDGQSEVPLFIAQLRSAGFEVEQESGSVNVNQIVSGKGVVGQSSVFNWLTEDGRALVAGLFEREKLSNRDVSVVQAKSVDGNLSDPVVMNGLKANMYSSWLSNIPAFAGKEGLSFKLMGVGKNSLTKLDSEEASMTAAGDVSQALALADNEEFDAILHFDQVESGHCMTIVPVSGGRLPASVPVIMIVTQVQTAESERGVVSKFSRPSGAGRGKARRRARG